MHPRLPLFASALLLLAACADTPAAVPIAPERPLALLAEIRCTATPATRTLSCADQGLSAAGSGARLAGLAVGGQHRYTRLTSSNIAVAGSLFSFDVTVQNLLQQPMATTDGTTPHAAGVRVFFASLSGIGGTGVVEVDNATGAAAFTASGQPYFQYGGSAGSELGADGMLARGETSLSKRWQIEFGTHTQISFTVYVATEVPDVDGSFLRFTQISAGGAHSCGITASGAYCWGAGGDGALGNGSNENSSVPVPVKQSLSGIFTQVSAGQTHTCGITSNGAYCWGPSWNAQATYEPVAVDQSTSGIFTQVSAGAILTCGITSTGAYCWGSGDYGQLGWGSESGSRAPAPVIQTQSGTFTQVSASEYHACGITSNGAYCWGEGTEGRLGAGPTTLYSLEPVAVDQTTSGVFTQVSTGDEHTCGVTSNGAYCWGKGANGRLGNGGAGNSHVPVAVTQTTSGTFTQVSAGELSTCGVAASGAYCWGYGGEGRLGNGGAGGSTEPVAVTQSSSGIFTQVSAGYSHVCGITASGAYCWGYDNGGRLGNGAPMNQSVPAPVAGSRGN